jgi:hypothetical protein
MNSFFQIGHNFPPWFPLLLTLTTNILLAFNRNNYLFPAEPEINQLPAIGYGNTVNKNTQPGIRQKKIPADVELDLTNNK